jgi:NAD+ kinase
MPKTKTKFDRIAFIPSEMPEAVAACARLGALYGDADPAEADAIVALGGDGHMLQTLHRFMNDGVPIYGMNRGSVGFLMNDYSEENLRERLADADVSRIHPLSMIAYDKAGKAHKALAINEVSLFRERHQAAKLRILVDDTARMEELVCDGVMVATPLGPHTHQSLPSAALARCLASQQGAYRHRSAGSR